MATRISTAARTAAVGAIAGLVDGGSGPGRIRIYTGTQPAGPGTTATGTLLAEFTCSDPAFTWSAGVATLDVTPAVTATGVAAGTAGWFRVLDSTEAAATGLGVYDGSVTATGGGGDLTLATTTVSIGLTVEITAATLTMPAS
jgi:hypothetical protein